MAEPMWRRMAPRSGVRVRTAATAALVVALALAVAGVALVLLLDRSLRSVAASQVELVAEQIAVPLAEGESPAEAVRNAGSPVALVQVIGPGSVVLAATAPLAGQAPMVTERPKPDVVVVGETGDLVLDRDDVFVVAARGVATTAGARTIVVAESLDASGRSVEVARNLMLVGGPVLVLVAGGATFVASGRALRPVEAIRARVAGLTDRDLDQRVPVPPVRDEVGRLAVTMNAMLGRLQAGQSAQRQFVADASHELRSPLSTIVAGLDLVRGRDGPDTARIAAMRADAERLTRLVDDLLLLARADERGLSPRAEEVDLDEVLYAEQLRLRSTAEVQVSVDVEAVRVVGDRAQLSRVVRNLVDNAARHCAGEIALGLRRVEHGAVLEVADNGPGIPVAERSQVFGRFVRLDAGRGRGAGGAGLGLAIVAEVVRAHRGRVEVLDGPRGGALFRVWLPAAPAPDPTPVMEGRG
ncbi:MAG: HAMP domain-containing histidine kinase [Pseudonocardia sp.]|nr:HAMP domain-containing histidine kinase [Pseudonocardia sp.]